MSNTNNKVGVVEKFTKDEFALYEPNCRPGGNGVNKRYPYLGVSHGSDAGFIHERETLEHVAKTDDARVRDLLGEHGHEMIALKLLHVLGDKEFDDDMVVFNTTKGAFTVDKKTWAGNQGCPFWKEVPSGDDGKEMTHVYCRGRGGVDYTITNTKLGLSKRVSALLPHLIFFHHFYEGDTEYRVSPEEFVELLEIKASEFSGTDWSIIERNEKGFIVGFKDTKK